MDFCIKTLLPESIAHIRSEYHWGVKWLKQKQITYYK